MQGWFGITELSCKSFTSLHPYDSTASHNVRLWRLPSGNSQVILTSGHFCEASHGQVRCDSREQKGGADRGVLRAVILHSLDVPIPSALSDVLKSSTSITISFMQTKKPCCCCSSTKCSSSLQKKKIGSPYEPQRYPSPHSH